MKGQAVHILIRGAAGRFSLASIDSSSSSSSRSSNVKSLLRPICGLSWLTPRAPQCARAYCPGGVPVIEIHSGAVVELRTVSPNVDVDTNTDIIRLFVEYDKLHQAVVAGGQVLLDDGLVALEVMECHDTYRTVRHVHCT